MKILDLLKEYDFILTITAIVVSLVSLWVSLRQAKDNKAWNNNDLQIRLSEKTISDSKEYIELITTLELNINGFLSKFSREANRILNNVAYIHDRFDSQKIKTDKSTRHIFVDAVWFALDKHEASIGKLNPTAFFGNKLSSYNNLIYHLDLNDNKKLDSVKTNIKILYENISPDDGMKISNFLTKESEEIYTLYNENKELINNNLVLLKKAIAKIKINNNLHIQNEIIYKLYELCYLMEYIEYVFAVDNCKKDDILKSIIISRNFYNVLKLMVVNKIIINQKTF